MIRSLWLKEYDAIRSEKSMIIKNAISVDFSKEYRILVDSLRILKLAWSAPESSSNYCPQSLQILPSAQITSSQGSSRPHAQFKPVYQYILFSNPVVQKSYKWARPGIWCLLTLVHNEIWSQAIPNLCYQVTYKTKINYLGSEIMIFPRRLTKRIN